MGFEECVFFDDASSELESKQGRFRLKFLNGSGRFVLS